MANVKISALTLTTAWTDDDLAVLVEDPGGSPLSRAITLENLLNKAWGQISTGTPGSQTLVATTWTKITQFDTNDLIARNATEDQANSRITIDNAGVYRVYASIVWTNDTSCTTEFAVYWNSATTAVVHPGKSGTGDEVAFEGLVDATTGATDFEIWARVSVGADVDVQSARFYVLCEGNT